MCNAYVWCFFPGQVDHVPGGAQRFETRDAGHRRRQGLSLRPEVSQGPHGVRLHRGRHHHNQKLQTPRQVNHHCAVRVFLECFHPTPMPLIALYNTTNNN